MTIRIAHTHTHTNTSPNWNSVLDPADRIRSFEKFVCIPSFLFCVLFVLIDKANVVRLGTLGHRPNESTQPGDNREMA